MQHKLGSRGNLEFGLNEMTLTIRRGWVYTLLLLGATVVGAACQPFMWEHYSEQETRIRYIGFILSGSITFFMVFQLIKALLYSEKYRMDLNGAVLSKQSSILSFTFNTTQKQWNKDSYFKYENVYDSYQRISSIWLVVSSKEKSESKRLIRFFDKETFLEFRNLFNEKFPAHKILEWHD